MKRADLLFLRFGGIALMLFGGILALVDKDPRPLHQPFDAFFIGFIAVAISYLEEGRGNRP